MSSTRTVNPFVVVLAAVGVGVVIMALANLPSRMPPDPFEEDEPREVVLEVLWDGDPRSQLIAYDVGDDEDEFETVGETVEGFGGWGWSHVTTALPDTIARLSSIQRGGRGPLSCTIYVDENQVGTDDTEHPGCFVEVTIP